jgi:tetratricopeptide (TPR) repeat protein
MGRINLKLLALLTIFPVVGYARSAPWVGVDLRGRVCGGSDTNNWFGPYDYTNSEDKAKHLRIVEKFHFTPDVENHIKGKTGYLGPDLNYTLMAWPNHARALLSIIRLQEKLESKMISFHDPENLLKTPVECYLQRAINFSPEDATSLSLFGFFLKKQNRLTEAKKYYEKALHVQPDNSKIAYSYGLLLFELKEYDNALEYAKRAYLNKKAPPGLRNKLKSLGRWRD